MNFIRGQNYAFYWPNVGKKRYLVRYLTNF
jgi:hypothetical protein